MGNVGGASDNMDDFYFYFWSVVILCQHVDVITYRQLLRSLSFPCAVVLYEGHLLHSCDAFNILTVSISLRSTLEPLENTWGSESSWMQFCCPSPGRYGLLKIIIYLCISLSVCVCVLCIIMSKFRPNPLLCCLSRCGSLTLSFLLIWVTGLWRRENPLIISIPSSLGVDPTTPEISSCRPMTWQNLSWRPWAGWSSS